MGEARNVTSRPWIKSRHTVYRSASRTDAIRAVEAPITDGFPGTLRIAAIRELLDRGYGRPRQAVEVTAPVGDPLDPLRVLMQEIDAIERKRTYKQTFEGISRS
jgi:hypothetical protein